MNSMIESFIELNDFYNIDAEIKSISCENTDKERKATLKSFANNNNKIQLLFNIRILNECIDIPSCDSIYISYPPKNKITTIQRIHRATRINKNNPYKIANIYIWCDQYDEILETLSSIKEYDIMFKDKIKLNTANFYNNQTEREIKLINKDRELLNTYTIGIKEFRAISWHDKLAQVEKYIKENGKLPSSTDKNIHIKSLHYWINDQKRNYKNNKQIMKNKEIRIEWEDFINKYEELFRNNKEVWKDKLNKIKDYIKENGKLPSRENKNDDIRKLFSWIVYQKMNYKYNKEIMKNEEIKKEWKDFINNYQELLKNNKEIWNDNLNKIEDYIKENGKLPVKSNKNTDIKKLATWIISQKRQYNNNSFIMKDRQIRIIWENFTEKYKEYF